MKLKIWGIITEFPRSFDQWMTLPASPQGTWLTQLCRHCMTFNPVREAAVGSGSHLLCFLSGVISLCCTYQSLYHPKGKERSLFLEDPIQICYISSYFSQNSLLIPFSLKTFALHMQHPLSHLHCITTFWSASFILPFFGLPAGVWLALPSHEYLPGVAV